MNPTRPTVRALLPRVPALLLAVAALAGCATAGGGSASRDPNAREWIQLFNGRDLTGWTPKFTTRPLGENYRNTVRAEDGLLKIRYDNWTAWNGEYGHIYYERPYSYYVIGAEYRFVGGQVPGAPASLAWAIRNNGLMLHSQPPETMSLNQDFPISIEVQLLGGNGTANRTTANLCTPGTHVVMRDSLVTRHCTNSASQTYHGDQWVRVEVVVLGDSVFKHVVNGDTVMTYTKPQMGGGSANNLNPGVMREGELLRGGYITIQAESAEIDFRKIELLNLEGCMDPASPRYKSYFVKSDPAQC